MKKRVRDLVTGDQVVYVDKRYFVERVTAHPPSRLLTVQLDPITGDGLTNVALPEDSELETWEYPKPSLKVVELFAWWMYRVHEQEHDPDPSDFIEAFDQFNEMSTQEVHMSLLSEYSDYWDACVEAELMEEVEDGPTEEG
jgi:hypothetical protein